MKKISRKLLLSVLSMAFAIVALGTTTFAWFTTNAQVTANITVGVQTTGDSILISDDCFNWGANVEIDADVLELNPVTYNATAATLDADADKFTELDTTVEANGGVTAANNYLQFTLYLKVSSASKNIIFDGTAMTDEVTNTATIENYSVLKPFTANYYATNALAGTGSVTFAAGNKIKVDAVNALRSIVDVSDAGDGAAAMEAETSAAAKLAAWASGPSFTRLDKIVAFEGSGAQPTTQNSNTINFGQSLAGDNAANAYIEQVLGTNFSTSTGADYKAAETNYAGHAVKLGGWATALTSSEQLFTTDGAQQIYALRFSYWLEGYDADCFDAIMGQGFAIKLGFKAQ